MGWKLGQPARLTARTRHFAIVLFSGLEDQALSLLLGLVDLVVGRLDRIGRRHILELDGDDAHSDIILVEGGLQVDLNIVGQIGTLGGQDLGDVGIADRPAHHRLGECDLRRRGRSGTIAVAPGVTEAVERA